MHRKDFSLLTIIFLLTAAVLSDMSGKAIGEEKKRTVNRQAVIWQQPNNIKTRNLFYGPGGRAGQPRAPFRFIEEDDGGGSPKFIIEDARGIRWKVKLGSEAKPETAATRLLWAVGYFADVNYHLPRARVTGLRKLSRGQRYISPDGTVNGARFERIVKKKGDWGWFDNPFVGTRQLNGLRVMMALMNNWDLKRSNNGIYHMRGGEQRYVVNDIGGTFGKTGGDWSRSKGTLEDYIESEFIDEVSLRTVDLVLKSRPPVLYAVAVPYYVKRTRMEKVAEDIPRTHARWIGQWLGRLSHNQIRDAFRGAGYAPHEANAYARKVRERIKRLNDL